jgi:hypothetical protein
MAAVQFYPPHEWQKNLVRALMDCLAPRAAPSLRHELQLTIEREVNALSPDRTTKGGFDARASDLADRVARKVALDAAGSWASHPGQAIRVANRHKPETKAFEERAQTVVDPLPMNKSQVQARLREALALQMRAKQQRDREEAAIKARYDAQTLESDARERAADLRDRLARRAATDAAQRLTAQQAAQNVRCALEGQGVIPATFWRARLILVE